MQDPFADFWIALVTAQCIDPAIDIMKTPLPKYIGTRDVKFLALKEGVEPTKFAVSRIDYKYIVQQTSTLGSYESQCMLAFRAGCKAVKKTDGTILTPTDFTDAPNGVRLAAQSWADDVAEEFTAYAVLEVGDVILQAAKLKKGQLGPFFYRVG